ncbi:transketolase family protein [Chloroflexota bacterium]
MRAAFIRTLINLARTDQRVFLVVGDVGYSLVEPFAQEFPDRFLNAGIAEQNMIGIATGLALSGKTVFAYSLANFPTLRCLEQVRNDACYHNVKVKIVSAGGGLAYGALSVTHHVTEDLAIMRALPNMTVVAPGDPVEAALATQAITQRPGPCYLRLARTGDPVIHQVAPDFQIGRALKMQDGNGITLIATGGILYNTMKAAEELAHQGIQARVLSMHTVKPLDTDAVLTASQETGAVMTIEEHNVIGGLGSAVAEVLAESGNSRIPFRRLGINDSFCSRAGSQKYLWEVHGLSIQNIVRQAIQMLKSE